jgi:CheY-like chemotaxis protein
MTNLDLIMLVDDDELSNTINRRILLFLKCSAKTDCYTNPREALDVLEFSGKRPDLLLLDLNMPEISGWQFLDRFSHFSSKWEKRPIIVILSSDSRELHTDNIKKYGIEKFMTKPLDEEQIFELMERYYPEYFEV